MQGLLIVVSGFSGVGKGTLMKELIRRYPEEYALSVSATTRKPREGEVDGREYFFKTREAFESLIQNDALVEYAVYNGNYYGTPKEYVERMRSEGKNVILEIEMQGGMQIKAKYPEALLLYVIPPSGEVLKKRLTGRGTETREEIRKRLKRAVEETEYITKYDEITVNDDFETCLNEIHELILKRQEEMTERRAAASRLYEELKKITEEEN